MACELLLVLDLQRFAMALSRLMLVHVSVGVEVKFLTQDARIQARCSWFWRSWQECFGNYNVI